VWSLVVYIFRVISPCLHALHGVSSFLVCLLLDAKDF
jgi:hypothetical protein